MLKGTGVLAKPATTTVFIDLLKSIKPSQTENEGTAEINVVDLRQCSVCRKVELWATQTTDFLTIRLENGPMVVNKK